MEETNGIRGKKRGFVDVVANERGHLVLEVVGRHALLFDDDSTAAFINSKEALMPWNGDQNLVLDRYDVRHLLQDLSALRKRRSSSSSSSDVDDAELDLERYRDLQDPPQNEASKRQKSTGDGYQNVPFLYGTEEAFTAARTSEEAMGSTDFKPPFSVPENLLSHLPPTEKTHQIIARTAKFVSEHGGQSEIVLRVKQGSNPAFGFLMPDHHLHNYFRFLVDHPEVLEAEKRSDCEQIAKSTAGEGLSLLGSVYGTGDDEDEGITYQSVAAKDGSSSIQDSPVDNISLSEGNINVLEQAESSSQKISHKDTCSSGLDAPPNNDTLVTPKQFSNLEVHSGDGLGTDAPNSPNMAKNDFLSVKTSVEKVTGNRPILEPPSFLKRVVQKMVEFIARNGKEFEGIIMNQDRTTGRFPFLLSSNQYHPYYLKVLEAAQKGELYEDDAGVEKFSSPSDVRRNESTKNDQPKKKISVAGDGWQHVARASTPEEINTTKARRTPDSEKKTKFKLVLGGIKKDGPDYGSGKPLGMTAEAAASAVRAATKKPGSFPCFSQGSTEGKDNEKKESGMSADAAAAIVMAATRGLRKSQLGGTSETEKNHGRRLGKILQGISEESDEVGSTGGSSSHYDASNLYLSNGGMTLPQSGMSGSNSKVVMDVCFPGQQSEDVSGASGSILRSDDSNKMKDDTSVAKVMVKAASCEADSSESCLSREEKLRAERLKRAKQFAALIKNERSALEDKNDQSTPNGAHSLQNELDSKATVCGSSYSGAAIQLDSLKGITCDPTTKGESRQIRAFVASEDYDNKSTAKCSDSDRQSHRHRHHHYSDYHKSSKSWHDNSDVHESHERRHKHESGKNHKENVTERKRNHEGSSHRSSDDVHRGHRHRSNFKDDDSGERHHYDSKGVHGHRSKDISSKKHTKSSSGKEHTKDSSHCKEHKEYTKGSAHGKEHTKEIFSKENSFKEDKEKSAVSLSKDIEVLASERSKSPTHATDVPDDLRAKVRAMLLATL